MAVAEGRERLIRLQAREILDDIAWDDTQLISYMQPQGLDHEALRAIFRAEVDELPVYVGVVNPEGGFNLIQISRVVEPVPDEKTTLENFTKQLQQMITQEEMSSYLAAIRQRYEVKIKQNSF